MLYRADGLEVLFRDADDRVLADKLQESLVRVTRMRDRKVRQRNDLAALKFPGVAVLIEPGFVANDSDRAKLLDAQLREAITRTIAEATIAHLNNA